MKKIYLTFFLLNFVLTLPLRAQNADVGEYLLRGNKLYAVITVLVVIFIGIVIFLVNMDRRIKALEEI